MTVTIKEITDKFYEVIDKYEEHEDWWEESEIKPKKENLIPFRNELEQVAVSYLEETDDTDDFVTAFAAFCTCVIRYDLVERDDWTYSDALKSIVASMSERVFPKYFDDYKWIIELLNNICDVITNNNYQNRLPSLYNDLIYSYHRCSIVSLFLFNYAVYCYCEYKRVNFFNILKKVYREMNDDYRNYALGLHMYSQHRDFSFNEVSSRKLLPFCFFGSDKDMITNATLSVYATVKERLGYKEKEKINPINFYEKTGKILFETKSRERNKENLITQFFYSDLFEKLNILQEVSYESSLWVTDAIDRETSPFFKDQAMHIPAIIAVPNLLQKILDDNCALDKALEEKTKAMEEKKNLIRGFSHTFKNMHTTSLYDVAEALLAMDDEDLKDWGRAVMLEYGEKETMIKEVEMLRLRYEDNKDKLMSIINQSMSNTSRGSDSITDIVNKAIKRCINTLVYDGSDEPDMIREVCLKEYDIFALRDSFEKEILFVENSDAVAWINQNILRMNISFSDTWKKLYFKKDCGMNIILTDLMTDLFMNVLKFADKTQPVDFDFSEDDSFLIIDSKNKSVKDKKGIPGNSTGLHSQNELLNYINHSAGNIANSVITESYPNGVFHVFIQIYKQVMNKEG